MISILTQIPETADTPTSILAAVIWLGGIIVAGLLIALRTLWKVNQDQALSLSNITKEHSKEQQDQLKDSLKVTIDATNKVTESEKTIEAAMTVIHQIAATRFTGDQLVELNFYLRTLRDLLSRGPNTGIGGN